MMEERIRGARDVVLFLKEQHEQIKMGFVLTSSPLFQRQLTLLQASVLVHAQAEESEEFERLGEVRDTEQFDRMRRAVQLAESAAPTRPHPGVESAVANLLVGPFASMLDRARDAISGKT